MLKDHFSLFPTAATLRAKAVRELEIELHHARLTQIRAESNVQMLTKMLETLQSEAFTPVHSE